jgi:hypothetical protein
MSFWPPNAPTLFSIAVNSANSIVGPLRVGGHKEALVSVVFAAASMEAFLNESVYLAESTRSVQPVISTFAQVIGEAEEAKAQIQAKFQLANLILTGRSYDKGSPPYQDFSDLCAVRNSLMHGKSNELFLTINGKPGLMVNPIAVMERLSSKHILHEAQPEHQKGYVAAAGDTMQAEFVLVNDAESPTPWSGGGSIRSVEPSSLKPRGDRLMSRWTYVIGTRAVAQWACIAASHMAIDLIQKSPLGGWKQKMEQYFLKPFLVSFE